MTGRDIIVIGASAGGVEALSTLVAGFPTDLPAAVFVVVHFPAGSNSALPAILSRRGRLPAEHPQDGDEILPGRIYVAPPDRHLLVKPGCLRLVRGPRENGSRPAVDPLFRTAARAYGRRVIGVVLTGNLDDGTSGLMSIRGAGGIGVVQDPEEALYAGMPDSAIRIAGAEHVLALAEIGPMLARLAREPVTHEEGEGEVPERTKVEVDIAEMDVEALMDDDRPGTPSGFGCPECHGALWDVTESDLPRFRCRVGHGYTGEALLEAQGSALDTAIWTAFRALKERAALARRMASRMEARGQPELMRRYREQEAEAEGKAMLIRSVLLRGAEEEREASD